MNAPYESTLSKVKNLPTKYYNNVFGFNYNQMIRPRSNNFKLYAIPKRFEGAIMNGTESDYILDGDLDLKIAENDSEYMEKQFKIDVGSFGSPDDELLKTKQYWTSQVYKMIQKETNLTYWALMSETCVCVLIHN